MPCKNDLCGKLAHNFKIYFTQLSAKTANHQQERDEIPYSHNVLKTTYSDVIKRIYVSNERQQYSLVYGPSLAGPNYSLKKQSSVFVLGFLLLPLSQYPSWSGKEELAMS